METNKFEKILLALVSLCLLALVVTDLKSQSKITTIQSPSSTFGNAGDYFAQNWVATTFTAPTGTQALMVPGYSGRQSLIIQNNSAIAVYLQPASTTPATTGYYLEPMATVNNPFTLDLNRPYVGPIYVVSASSTATTSLLVNYFY